MRFFLGIWAIASLWGCSVLPRIVAEREATLEPRFLGSSGAIALPNLEQEQQKQVNEVFNRCRIRDDELRKSAQSGSSWSSFWTVFGSVSGPVATAGGALVVSQLNDPMQAPTVTLLSAAIGGLLVTLPAILAATQSNLKTRAADLLQSISVARTAVFKAPESEQLNRIDELNKACLEAQ